MRDGKDEAGIRGNPGRRRLLKILGIAGGAAAAGALLPGKWMQPLATLGSLPAHAQVSGDRLVVRRLRFEPGGTGTASAQEVSVDATFDYADGLCKVGVDYTALVAVIGDASGYSRQVYGDNIANIPGLTRTGGPCKGTIHFSAYDPCCSPVGWMAVQIFQGMYDRVSNTLNESFSFPPAG